MQESASSEDVAKRLEELGLSLDPAIRFNLATVFPKVSGWGAKGNIKRKHLRITRIQDRLKQMLNVGEEVLYVAKGVQVKFSEQYFLGLWANLINQTVFVLTNLRLLMLHTDTKGRPRHTFWTIYYNQIQRFKPTWTGNLLLHLRDGTKLRFAGFSKGARKEMPRIFQEALQSYQDLKFDPEVTQSRENLCGFCMRVVPKDQYRCPFCAAEFWQPRELALRSLIFPSWGDFLMRHWAIALFEMFTYVIVWVVLIAGLADAAANPAELPGALLFMVCVLGAEHSVDALLTYFIAKKGLNPKKLLKNIPPAREEVPVV